MFTVCEDDEEVFDCKKEDLCGADNAETCEQATSSQSNLYIILL